MCPDCVRRGRKAAAPCRDNQGRLSACRHDLTTRGSVPGDRQQSPPSNSTSSASKSVQKLAGFKHHETRLAKAQQSMSRKVRFSRNWKKAKARVNRIHAGIANARRDYLHKASATLSKNHVLVAIEDLQVKNMSKSAAGTADQPGKKVRAKGGVE